MVTFVVVVGDFLSMAFVMLVMLKLLLDVSDGARGDCGFVAITVALVC